MKILIACEFSGRVREEFWSRGHAAMSCDLLPTEIPGCHVETDVKNILCDIWDLVIAFPPCTHLASSGARWFPEKREDGRQQEGIDFFMQFVEFHEKTGVPVAIENPVGIMSTCYRKPDQIIQPWQFGHPETKATCLWLHGLPELKPTDIVEGREQRIWKMPPSDERAKLRSLTYPGIAQA
ncbi:MAG: DNA cytosine methyltransferase, partial [Planctomycetaceae bacterium]|nr:DNA cytosine methyltransferase [Planctomycetaceae bacterium]